MKTRKFFIYGLLVLAFGLLVTAIIAFVNGHILYGICNILWMGCEIVFWGIIKKSDTIIQSNDRVYGFLNYMNDIIEKSGAAIIDEDEDGCWRIREYLPIEHKEPSCSAENNDQIAFGNNSNMGDKK